MAGFFRPSSAALEVHDDPSHRDHGHDHDDVCPKCLKHLDHIAEGVPSWCSTCRQWVTETQDECTEEGVEPWVTSSTWGFACNVCDYWTTVLACVGDWIQCANCFALLDVNLAWAMRCEAQYSSMNPVSVKCKKDGTTHYMKWFGSEAHSDCDCGTRYYYDHATRTVYALDAVPSTGLFPTAPQLDAARRLLAIRDFAPCPRPVKTLKGCCPDGSDDEEGDETPAFERKRRKRPNLRKNPPKTKGCPPPPPAQAVAACPVWVKCPPWTKVSLAWVLANCNKGKAAAFDIPCPPPPTCRTVHFVNTGTGSPFGDEEAALEAAWRQLVEDEGVPQQAIHGCSLKPGTKITYSPTGGPSSAEVCCQIDYWCDPYTKKGNLPGGLVCCCPSKQQGSCPPMPPLPPPPPDDLPPLRSGAERQPDTKYCCYEAKHASIGYTTPGSLVEWYGDTMTPDEVAKAAAAPGGPGSHVVQAIYFTGKEYGDSCKDKDG